jgi:WhiB family redox-sensing transcriptional regulator
MPGEFFMQWRDIAACRGTSIDIWFAPENAMTPKQRSAAEKERVSLAKKICAGCPVREECLRYALDHDERHGILGGLTPGERRKRK